MQELADEISNYEVETMVCVADLSQPEQIEKLHMDLAGCDVGLLVASAGFGTSGAFVEGNVADELSMIDVNCRALVANTHHFAQKMKQRGSGGIILLSSIVAFQGNAWSANYSATKAFVQTLAEGMASELKPQGIDVLAVAPGPTASGFAQRARMKLGQTIAAKTVATQSLGALGKKTTVTPGMLSKVLRYAMTGLPRWAKTSIMSNVMKNITKHQQLETS